MSDPVSSIRNLGPATDALYASVGIHDAQTLRDMGADAAYTTLLQAGRRPHFIAYYALVMGLQGRPWNDCQGDEKAALRTRFDALKAGTLSDRPTGIDAALAEIGVIEKRR